jgi:hypothetical protein
MTLKGRYWTLLWLVTFLAVALGVSARQRRAFGTATELRTLRVERRDLEARVADLEQRIRTATARGVLDVKVERTLGLRAPDSKNSSTVARIGRPPGDR